MMHKFQLRAAIATLTLFLLAFPIAWFVVSAESQRATVARIEQLGGYVKYDFEYNWDMLGTPTPPRTKWVDYSNNVKFVSYVIANPSQSDLRLLRSLPRLHALSLAETHVSSTMVAYLESLPTLRLVHLWNCSIEDKGRLQRSPIQFQIEPQARRERVDSTSSPEP